MALRNRLLIGSLLSGLASAFVTWLMIGDHAAFDLMGSRFKWLGGGMYILVLPGLFAGMIVSGNVHLGNTWVVALGNFLFFFSLVYFIGRCWKKRRAKSKRDGAPPSVSSSRII